MEQGTSKKENVANKGDVGVRKNEKRGKEKEGTVRKKRRGRKAKSRGRGNRRGGGDRRE